MRFLQRALTGLFLVSLTVGLLAVAGIMVRGALEESAAQESAEREARERVFAANVVTITLERIVPELGTFGEVQSRLTLEVRASVAGRVVDLGEGVEEGGAVREGQLLFRIDPTDTETALAIAETDLQDAEAELSDALRAAELAADGLESATAQAELQSRAVARQRDLQERGVGTAAAIESAELAEASSRQAELSRRQALAGAEARVSQAETALSRARIALAEAERDVADTRVTAAFDGVLSDLSVVRGGLVSANERVADLIDPAALEVAFRISTPEYARLLDAEGALAARDVTAMLEVSGLSVESPARITRESAAVGEGQTGRQLFAQLAQPKGFRPGDFVRVTVAEPALDGVVRLPATAVSSSGGVLLLGDDDRLVPGEVEILRRQRDDVLVRAEGLEGREVVSERSPLLGAGIKVRPLRQGAQREEETAGGTAELLELSDERRARLVAFIEGNARMPADAKERVLAQLREPRVAASVVASIEGRMGG